jgi:hypothetical protein
VLRETTIRGLCGLVCPSRTGAGPCKLLLRSALLATVEHQCTIKQDARGRDSHVGVRHTCATACAVASNAAKTVEHRFDAVRARAG